MYVVQESKQCMFPCDVVRESKKRLGFGTLRVAKHHREGKGWEGEDTIVLCFLARRRDTFVEYTLTFQSF